MKFHLRVARPVSDIDRATRMYTEGLNFEVLYRFQNHAGFDGTIVGQIGGGYHIEFTRSRNHFVKPTPTPEDLLVFYVPSEPEWLTVCSKMRAAGFQEVKSYNPYWDQRARTFLDQDAYRVVLHRGIWA